MNKDDLIRAYYNSSASWKAVVLFYGIIVGGWMLAASAIL